MGQNTNILRNIAEDRRYFPRWEVENKIVYCEENNPIEYECLSKDIHCSGLCLKSDRDIPLSTHLNLKISLTNDIDPVMAAGHVVWTLKSASSNLVGVQFDRIGGKSKETIFDYAFEYKHDQLMNLWFSGW